MQRDNIIHRSSRAQSTFTVHEGGIHHMTIGREVGIKANQYWMQNLKHNAGLLKQCITNGEQMHSRWRYGKHLKIENHHFREEVRKGSKHHLSYQEEKIRLNTFSLSLYQKLLSQEIKKIYWGDITWHMRISEVAECITNITLKWGSVSIQVLKQCSFGIGLRPQNICMGQAGWLTVVI